MKTPLADPLLTAILEDAEPDLARCRAEASLATLRTAARWRRQTRARRRWAFGGGLTLLALAGWLGFQQPGLDSWLAGPARSFTLVRNGPRDSSLFVRTRPGTFAVTRSRDDTLQLVSTRDVSAPVEVASGDDALLALLPAGAGLIDDGPDGRFLWLGSSAGEIPSP